MRQYTKEECREMLIDQFLVYARYWKDMHKTGRLSTGQCPFEGLVHSILAAIDGESELPAFDLITQPHQNDMMYRMDREENWWPERLCINDDVHLHDLMYAKRRGRND